MQTRMEGRVEELEKSFSDMKLGMEGLSVDMLSMRESMMHFQESVRIIQETLAIQRAPKGKAPFQFAENSPVEKTGSSSSEGTGAAVDNPPLLKARLKRLELPLFGGEDPHGCTFQKIEEGYLCKQCSKVSFRENPKKRN